MRLNLAFVLRRLYTRKLSSVSSSQFLVDKFRLDNLITRRSFLIPSFELHGGVSGLYDFGPPGFAIKENILALWKSHFVIEEGLLQIESTALTPQAVLKASGHVDKFTDIMVKDVKTGECFRADKLVEEYIQTVLTYDSIKNNSVSRDLTRKTISLEERLELDCLSRRISSLSITELEAIILRFKLRSPSTGNELTRPYPFNLMFSTLIGPSSTQTAYLRPETAQGIFVNFKKLYEFHGSKLPMGIAQIGSAFRNEIAPRNGLLRVREFTLAEIEYFVHPEKKKHHEKFNSIKDLSLPLYSAKSQQELTELTSSSSTSSLPSWQVPTPLYVAVQRNEIGNETLAYFMAKTYLFLVAVGINPNFLRFRQHLPTEMAHYAASCWDAEIYTSQGWIECVGLADRSAYDLEAHSIATGIQLYAKEKLVDPIDEPFISLKVNRKEIGKVHKSDQAVVVEALEALSENKATIEKLEDDFKIRGTSKIELSDGRTITLTKEMISSIERGIRKVSERRFIPHVVEPSFGIGRIMSALFEHSFYIRNDDLKDNEKKREGEGGGRGGSTQDLSRCVMRFSPQIAPYKAVILPLDGRVDMSLVQTIARSCMKAGVSAYIDDSSGSVGKRYARADELGVPFAITVDFDSVKDTKVTIRERDSTTQIRVSANSVVDWIKERLL